MASEKQIAANRRNAQKSTGPKTPEGKERCKMNALKHGFTARSVLIPGEDPDVFAAFHQAFRDSFQPRDAMDEALIWDVATNEWRLQRFKYSEAGLFWYRKCLADLHAVEKKNGPDRPQSPEDWDQVRLGRALQFLSSSNEGHLNAVSRYEATLRRSITQSRNQLEQRLRERARQQAAAAQPAGAPPPRATESEPLPSPQPPAAESWPPPPPLQNGPPCASVVEPTALKPTG